METGMPDFDGSAQSSIQEHLNQDELFDEYLKSRHSDLRGLNTCCVLEPEVD
jgi:hypothetical protein